MRIIIGNGKVSNIIKKDDDIILSHSDIEISNMKSVWNILKHFKNSKDLSIVNTAAKINLEWCEENKHEAYNVNTFGAINLLEASSRLEAKFVQISSGCIYDGNQKVISEADAPTPAAWYTKTKTWADEAISNFGYNNYLILRPRQLISSKSNKTNMLTKFLSFDSIAAIDEQNSLTCIEDLSKMIDFLIENAHTGIYNCANEGTTSPYEIAIALQKIKPSLKVSKVLYDDYLKTLKVRRVNTILSVDKLTSLGYQNRSAQSALEWCIGNYHE
jgi:dTDP-4-dehydrorhamnose reductase